MKNSEIKACVNSHHNWLKTNGTGNQIQWKRKRLAGKKFININFSKATFFRCEMYNAYFENCVFCKTVFTICDLNGAVFNNCTFVKATFANSTDLNSSVFMDCKIKRSLFSTVDLIASKFYDTEIENTTFNKIYARNIVNQPTETNGNTWKEFIEID